jgi:hypothetical protein
MVDMGAQLDPQAWSVRPSRASSGIGQPRRSAIIAVACARASSGSSCRVEVHQVLGDGPGQGGLAVRVAGDQPGLQPSPGCGRKPVVATAQDPADAVERICGAAAVAEGVLLHATTDVIDA